MKPLMIIAAVLLASPAWAQPAVPCAPDSSSVTETMTTSRTWRCSLDGQFWLEVLPLISGTNIKTINGASTLGAGDLVVSGSGVSYVVTTQTTTNTTVNYADITGLAFNVAANTRYRISCVIPYTANAITTGIGISWTGPTAPTLTRALAQNTITTATIGGTLISGNDTGAATTASNPAANVSLFEGIWSNGATGGVLQFRVRSEVAVANAITVAVGAVCSYAVY